MLQGSERQSLVPGGIPGPEETDCDLSLHVTPSIIKHFSRSQSWMAGPNSRR